MTDYLVFKDKLFHETNLGEIKESDLAVLAIDGTESTLYLNESITLIDKLTAQRQVNSITKTGFLLQNNMRVGSKSNLKIVTGSIPIAESKAEQKPIAQSTGKPSTLSQNEQQSVPEKEVKTKPRLQETEGPLIIPPVEKEKNDSEMEQIHGGFQESSDNPKDLTDERKESSLSIADVFREEQKMVMTNTNENPEKVKTYDEVIEYFWKSLFGQVYDSWDSLPQEAKEDFFSSLNIKQLSDEDVQELFKIRHENNIEGFKRKLNEFKDKYKE